MPLDAQHAWDRAAMVTAEEVLASLREAYELAPVADPDRGSAPAETWLLDGPDRASGHPGARVGIVGCDPAVLRSCDRVRLTADGQLRNCLFARRRRPALRAPRRCGRRRAGPRFVAAVAGKRAGHGIDDPGFLQPARPMSAIGG